MKRTFLLAILLAISSLHSTEDCPWFRTYFLPYVTLSTNYKTYEGVAIDNHHVDYWGSGFEESLSLYISPLKNWCFEAEVVAADDRDRYFGFGDGFFGFDSGKLTGRYLLFSDLQGDPFSLSLGLSFAGVSSAGLRDRSFLHSGREEYSFHTALGKEISCGPNWLWHFWGVVGISIADRGSPWAWGKIAVSKQIEEYASWDLFAATQCGFGNHRLDLEGRFNGYGAVRYRSIDIGGAFRYKLNCGEVEIDYRWRAWAQNCPESAHQIALCFIIPWSL